MPPDARSCLVATAELPAVPRKVMVDIKYRKEFLINKDLDAQKPMIDSQHGGVLI